MRYQSFPCCARSSRPRMRAGVLAAQRAASVGAGLRNRATAQRPALDGGQGGGTMPGDGPTPAPTARPSQIFGAPSALHPVKGRGLGRTIPAPAGAALPAIAATQGGRGCAGRRPPAATGRFGLDCGGAVLTVNRGLQPVRPQSCGRARTRLRLRGRAGKLGSDAQIGRERARSAKGRRGQRHGNYALNAHLAHRCPQLPGEREMKSPAGAGLSAPEPVGAAR